MKTSIRIARVTCSLALASSLGCIAYPVRAQPGETASAPISASASARELRAVNRKLAHRVENALARTRGLNAARLIVTARAGHITLSGAVTYNEQIALAVSAARQVDGVIDVDDRIRVSGASL